MPERSRERFTRDPFAITPDPEVYVPRVATETAREQLLRSACNPEKTTALLGPPGLGKTLLLHLLAREVPEDVQTVYLPCAALPPAELCDWAIRLLALPAADDPIEILQAFGGDLREQGRSLLISIDDATALPLATARWAGEFVRNSNGSIRLALAAADNDTGNRAIAAIGSNFDIVHLSDPMTESETRKYIDERLALAGVPDSIRARFDDRTVSRLHRVSNGIPRRLHTAAAAVLQETPAADADDGEDAPSAPVGVPSEPTAPAQTLGVPRGERRQSQRRAEPPEGVAVRVGPDGAPAEKGRRAEDRVEVPPEVSESAAEDFAKPEPIERAEVDERPISDWELETAPASPRRAPSRQAIALTSLLVVFTAVAIPVIRSTLSEPPQVAAIEPGASAARAEEPRIAEPPAVEPPPPEPAEILAVQINASPWANIEVDGIDLGATPLANIPLFAGEHSFRAKMPDGRVIERTIEIDAERRFITFE